MVINKKELQWLKSFLYASLNNISAGPKLVKLVSCVRSMLYHIMQCMTNKNGARIMVSTRFSRAKDIKRQFMIASSAPRVIMARNECKRLIIKKSLKTRRY